MSLSQVITDNLIKVQLLIFITTSVERLRLANPKQLICELAMVIGNAIYCDMYILW